MAARSHHCDGRDLSCPSCAAIAQQHEVVRAAMTRDDQLDDLTRVRIWNALEPQLALPVARSPWRVPRLVVGFGAFAAAAAAVVVIVMALRDDPARTLTVAEGATLSSPIGPHTRAGLVGPAEVEVVRTGPATAIRLRRGTFVADFDGGPGRSLRIEAPGATIEIVGTLFAVEARASASCISVAHGTVRVTTRSSPLVTLVTSGQTFCSDTGARRIAPPIEQLLARHEQTLTAAVTPSRAHQIVATAPTTPSQATPQTSLPLSSTTPSPTTSTPSASTPSASTPSSPRTSASPSASTPSTSSRTTSTAPASPTSPRITTSPSTSSPATPSRSTPSPSTPSPSAPPRSTPPHSSPRVSSTPQTSSPQTSSPPTSSPQTSSPQSPPSAPPQPTPPPPIARPTADELYRTAERALANRDTAAADRALERLITDYPSSPLGEQALYERARLAHQKRAWASARRHLDRLLALPQPRLVEPARYLVCRIAVEAGDGEATSCLVEYRKSYPRSPHDIDVLGLLIEREHKTGGCRAVSAQIDELVRLHPRSELTRAWRARCEATR